MTASDGISRTAAERQALLAQIQQEAKELAKIRQKEVEYKNYLADLNAIDAAFYSGGLQERNALASELLSAIDGYAEQKKTASTAFEGTLRRFFGDKAYENPILRTDIEAVNLAKARGVIEGVAEFEKELRKTPSELLQRADAAIERAAANEARQNGSRREHEDNRRTNKSTPEAACSPRRPRRRSLCREASLDVDTVAYAPTAADDIQASALTLASWAPLNRRYHEIT